MVVETREHSVDIRGVTATLVDVVVAGHTVELVLSYDVEEAEAVHGTQYSDGVDEAAKRGMFHMEGFTLTVAFRPQWWTVPRSCTCWRPSGGGCVPAHRH